MIFQSESDEKIEDLPSEKLQCVYFSSFGINTLENNMKHVKILLNFIEGDRRSEATEVDRLLNPCAYVIECFSEVFLNERGGFQKLKINKYL